MQPDAERCISTGSYFALFFYAKASTDVLDLSPYLKRSRVLLSCYLPYYLFNTDDCSEWRNFLTMRRVYKADLDKLVDDYLAAPAGSDIHQHRSRLLDARLAEKAQRDKLAVKCSDWFEVLLMAREAELKAKRDLWLSQ